MIICASRSKSSGKPLHSSSSSSIPTETVSSANASPSACEEEEPTAAAASTKSFLDDGFVFGMEGSGLDRPKGKVSQLVVDGDSLETTNQQRIIVWSTLFGHFGVAAYSVLGILQANNDYDTGTVIGVLQTVMLTVCAWTTADLGSGVLHWSVDNYGNGKTPVMGGIIAAFQGHHAAMWTICERGFENNVHKLCIPFGCCTVVALKLLFGLDAYWTYFWTVFCVMEILSQEFHKMSHATKSEAGPIWNMLQEKGLIIDRKSHAQHHIAPFDGNYCIISGVCNKFLDESGFFRRMEHIVYKLNGVESNAWKLDPKLRERTLRGDYGLPPSIGATLESTVLNRMIDTVR